MQPESIQHHIDNIRNILSMPNGTIEYKKPFNHTDKLTNFFEKMGNKYDINIDDAFMFVGMITFITMMFHITNIIPYITPCYIIACVYIMYNNYTYWNTCNMGLKRFTSILLIIIQLPIIVNLIPKTQHYAHHSYIDYTFTIILLLINSYTLIDIFTNIITNKPIVGTNAAFMNYESRDLSEEIMELSHYTMLLHWNGDRAITLGTESNIHYTLKQRYIQSPNKRSILEQQLYSLSQKLPLIHITYNNNCIIHKPLKDATMIQQHI